MLANFLGYKVDTQRPSKVMVEFTKYPDLLNDEVKVPKGTKVSTSDETVIFETEEDLIIPSGTLTTSVSCVQGETIKSDILGKSDGSKNQEFQLTFTEVLLDTIQVFTEREDKTINAWDSVENFLYSGLGDRHYLSYDDGEFAYVRFSDGNSGKVPETGVKILVTYRIGGGTIGNVGENKIVYLYDDYIEGIESVNNPQAPYIQGQDREPVESIRINAPRNFRTNDRIVTPTDLEDKAVSLANVSKAKAKELFDNLNTVELYIVPYTYDIPSTEIKESVINDLKPLMIANTSLVVKDPTYLLHDIVIDLEVEGNFVREEVKEQLRTAIEETYHISTMDFGESIKPMSFYSLSTKIQGIENMAISSAIPVVGEFEVLKINSITINATGGVVIA